MNYKVIGIIGYKLSPTERQLNNGRPAEFGFNLGNNVTGFLVSKVLIGKLS